MNSRSVFLRGRTRPFEIAAFRTQEGAATFRRLLGDVLSGVDLGESVDSLQEFVDQIARVGLLRDVRAASRAALQMDELVAMGGHVDEPLPVPRNVKPSDCRARHPHGAVYARDDEGKCPWCDYVAPKRIPDPRTRPRRPETPYGGYESAITGTRARNLRANALSSSGDGDWRATMLRRTPDGEHFSHGMSLFCIQMIDGAIMGKRPVRVV